MSNHTIVSEERLFSPFPASHPYPVKDDPYQEHLIEQYKLYVATTDNISDRRQAASTYFLAVNSGLLAFVGYATPKESMADLWLLGLAGMTLSYLWYRIVRSYHDLNAAKFLVIKSIETRLPLRPFDAEWQAMGEGRNPRLYKPVTHVEIGVPWVFFILHALVVLMRVPWKSIIAKLSS